MTGDEVKILWKATQAAGTRPWLRRARKISRRVSPLCVRRTQLFIHSSLYSTQLSRKHPPPHLSYGLVLRIQNGRSDETGTTVSSGEGYALGGRTAWPLLVPYILLATQFERFDRNKGTINKI
jgi:hypothetical protein